MSRRPDTFEQDLLDLIEGRLPADRVESMRAALRADPALARKVQAMVADRAAIRQASLSAERDAPRGLVADAVTRAERETLLNPNALSAKSRRMPARRIAAMLAVTLILGAALTGSVMFLSSDRGSPENRLAASTPSPTKSARGGTFEVPNFDAPARSPSAPLPDLGAIRSNGASAPSSPPAFSDTADDLPQTPSASRSVPSAQEQVARWNREVAQKIAGESGAEGRTASAPASAAPNATVGGMRLAEAARLAVEGRLRITTTRRQDNAAFARAQSGAAPGAGPTSEQRTPDSFTVELTTRYDPELSALQDALAALAERLAGDSFGPRGQVRFTAAPVGASDAAPAIPSFRADDVLWWTRPVSTWERAISVQAPVRVVPESD